MALHNLTRGELIAFGKFLDKNVSWEIETNQSITAIIQGRWPARTLKDSERLLRKQGVITSPDSVQDNLVATGTASTKDEGVSQNDTLKAEIQKKLKGQNFQLQYKYDSIKDLLLDDGFESSKKAPEEPRRYALHSELMEIAGSFVKDFQALNLSIDKETEKTRKLLSELQASIETIAMRPVSSNGTTVQQVNIYIGDSKLPQKFEAQFLHGCFEKGLRLLKAGLSVLLVGPAGCGKTTVAEQWAKALGVPYYFQSLTAGTPESALTVRLLPLGVGGAMRCVASPTLMAFGGLKNGVGPDGLVEIQDSPESAGLILWDECDSMDANTALILNAMLANKKMTIEALAVQNRPTVIFQAKGNHVVAAANTFGTGTDMQYAGRNALDAAFLDRFYVMQMGYDPILEAHLARLIPPKIEPWRAAQPPTDGDWRKLAHWVINTRKKIEAGGYRKVWGTRNLLKAQAARYAGIPAEEIKRDLMSGFPHDLMVKLLVEDEV